MITHVQEGAVLHFQMYYTRGLGENPFARRNFPLKESPNWRQRRRYRAIAAQVAGFASKDILLHQKGGLFF